MLNEMIENADKFCGNQSSVIREESIHLIFAKTLRSLITDH